MKHRIIFLGLVGCFFLHCSLTAWVPDRLKHGARGITKGAVAGLCYASTVTMASEFIEKIRPLWASKKSLGSIDSEDFFVHSALTACAALSLGYITVVVGKSSINSLMLFLSNNKSKPVLPV